jgi:hypothetical protein
MRRFLLVGLIVALAACNNDSTSPNGSAVGTYSLRTYNGANLPVDFGGGVLLQSDVLTMNANGTYTDVAQFTDGPRTEQGSWSINNNLITFNDFTDGISYTGSLSGSVLTETFPQTGGGTVTEVYQHD